ncbi:MAG: FAD-linked oxidase C-terminal domain-containing protein [Candidatus Obscuribacterales bacterium]
MKLIPRAQAVETMLAYFNTVEAAGQAVSDVIASGVVPAAMELVDQLTLNAVEDSWHMGRSKRRCIADYRVGRSTHRHYDTAQKS